jgi:hypothetical protein
VLAALLAFIGIAIFWYIQQRDVIDLGYSFDEVWRIDYIASTSFLERYRTHDTPIPPGWIVLARLVLRPSSIAGLPSFVRSSRFSSGSVSWSGFPSSGRAGVSVPGWRRPRS